MTIAEIIPMVVALLEMADDLVAAAKRLGAEDVDLERQIAEARARRAAQVTQARADELKIFAGGS